MLNAGEIPALGLPAPSDCKQVDCSVVKMLWGSPSQPSASLSTTGNTHVHMQDLKIKVKTLRYKKSLKMEKFGHFLREREEEGGGVGGRNQTDPVLLNTPALP